MVWRLDMPRHALKPLEAHLKYPCADLQCRDNAHMSVPIERYSSDLRWIS